MTRQWPHVWRALCGLFLASTIGAMALVVERTGCRRRAW
jgi:hypothetical protein